MLKYNFFIVFSLFIWSTYSFILKKISINPVIFTFLTTIFGWFFLTFFIVKNKISIKVSCKNLLFLLILTILFLTNSFTFFYSYQLTSISNAIFSHYLAPVFVALLAPLILKEHIEKTTIIALLLSIAGMILIFASNGINLSFSKNDFIGIFMGVISAFCYGLLIVIVKNIMVNLNYYVVMFFQGLFTLLIFLIIFPFIKNYFTIDFSLLKILILIGFTHSFLAPVIYLHGLQHVKAQVAGLLGYSEIIGSLLIGIIFFHEIPHFFTLIGGSLIILAGSMVIINAQN